MKKTNYIKELVEQLTAGIPENLKALRKDFEKNCRSVLESTFQKFDVVTREEFDVQTKVLARSRKKIEELEKKLQQLEKQMQKKRRD